jgi:hypothetical protein
MLKDIFVNTETLIAFTIGLVGIIYLINLIKTSKHGRNEVLGYPVRENKNINVPGLSWEINKEKKYSIDNMIVWMQKRDKTKKYQWDDFEYFFRSPNMIITDESMQSQWDFFIKKIRDNRGEVFYLKLKPTGILSKLITNVVVMYARPDNHVAVYGVLSQKLVEREGLVASLMYYQFK